MRHFRGLTKYHRAVAWAIVTGYVLQIALAIWAGNLLLTLPFSALNVFLMFAAMVFIGTRFRGLNNIIHECSHATFSSHRQDNTILGSICAAIVMGSFKEYRDEHLSHHAHLGDYEHDMDLQGIQDLGLHEPLTSANLLRHFTNPFLGRHLPYYLGVNLSGRDGILFQILKFGLLAGTVAFILINPITALLFVVVPFAFIYSTINYWTDCLDHAGLVASEDELDASRNVLAPMPLRALLFPRNDCFHLVHHLFPHIPARHLAKSHKTLLDDPLYQQKQNATQPVHMRIASIPKAIAGTAEVQS